MIEEGKEIKIYRRLYDGQGWGEGEPNSCLGKFKILKNIDLDAYAGKWIAEKDGKRYMIIQTEVSGMYNPDNGGSRFEIVDIETSKESK